MLVGALSYLLYGCDIRQVAFPCCFKEEKKTGIFCKFLPSHYLPCQSLGFELALVSHDFFVGSLS